MANKLLWNPPKWKSYSFDGTTFKVELETGEIFKGTRKNKYISFENHISDCFKIFGIYIDDNGPLNKLSELSKVLDLELMEGYWPECHNVAEFIKRYYERVAKIEKTFTKSFISIESEIDITPKFTI